MKSQYPIHSLPLRLLALVPAVLLLCACSSQPDVKYRIGISQCSDDAWRTKFNEEVQRELLFHPGVEVEIRSADDDNARQAADVDYFLQQKVDLLIVAPNEAEPLTPAVTKAYETGTPVIVVDRKVKGEKFTAAIAGDNYECGRLMAQYLLMHLPEGGKVVEVLGLVESTPSQLRHRGMMETLGAGAGRYEFVQCVGDWFREKGREAVAQVLRANLDARFILAQNDQMAIGASEAVHEVLPQRDIPIMGVDGLTGPGNGVEAIERGLIDASAVYSTSGDLVLRTAVDILEGKPYERDVQLPTYLIDPETAPLLNNIYKEVDHQVETVHMLKDRVDYFWQQHNLERTLLYTVLTFLALALVMIVIILRSYQQKRRLNESLARQKETLQQQRDQLMEQRNQLEQQNGQLKALTRQVEEATQAKLMFFTNVSHDFRTPLTLINGPIEQVLSIIDHEEHAEPTADSRHQAYQLMQLAHKNVQVLLRLVNQILDFRKYESGKMELNLQPVDLAELTRTWTESFQGLAHKRHIKLQLEDDSNNGAPYQTMGDLPKLERIFFNLVGNAFKFTPENGRITVRLSREGDSVRLRIADTGPGISVEHIQHIFENFYQVDSAHHEGSGIGLALVKNFVELHGGTIEVANQEVGTGTIFTVTLPVREVQEVDRDVAPAAPSPDLREQAETEFGAVLEDETLTEEEPRPIVLVIDDNQDICAYMKVLLGGRYRVLTAGDGQEGIRKAMRMVPDAIVCDVMMPGIDGIETCSRLKHEVNTCHIPVMMLTACSLDEQRVQGLTEGGADAYMSKPFNQEVLMAQLDSLIQNHNRVRDFFKGTGDLGPSPAALTSPLQGEALKSPSGGATGDGDSQSSPCRGDKRGAVGPLSLDDRFLLRMRRLIDEHLADSDFGVEQLGEAIGMSRAQLYRKTKALTNYSPVELIRNTRLKRAQQMLAQGDETIAQVAYQVGFTAPSYFTKCYKDYFGEMPNELVRRKG